MMGPDWSPADCAGPCYSAATHVLDCGAEEERRMVEDKSLPVWELPLVMGGKVVGVSIFDGKGGMRGTVTDPDAIAALRGGGYSISAGPYPVLPPMSIATRPEDWAPEARAIIWPEGKL